MAKMEIAQQLAQTLSISQSSGYCQTAEESAHFKTMMLLSKWEGTRSTRRCAAW